MKTTDITITAATTWLPDKRELPEEIGSSPQKSGYTALAVSDESAVPDMAVRAATRVLQHAGVDGADVDLVLHAWAYYQGHDYWSPAHYVASRSGAHNALPIGIYQMCNGGGAAVQSAATHLLADTSVRRALVTTADRFCLPGFDRWRGDLGVAYGDGGAAVLLEHGPPRNADGLVLRAITSVAAPHLEEMNRGHNPFAPAPRAHVEQVDARRTKKDYLRDHGVNGYREVEGRSLRTLVTNALAEAGVAGDDPALRVNVLPRLREDVLQGSYVPVVTELTTAPALDVGRTTGHLGAGDLPAGIAEVFDQKLLEPGELALVFGTGAGFTWSCAVVQRPETH